MNKRQLSRTVLLITTLIVTGCTPNKQPEKSYMPSGEESGYLQDGQLIPCPKSPNCVSSEGSQKSSTVAPLEFSGSATEAWQTLQDALQGMGGRIETTDGFFLHATFRSRLFRFVDDLHCRLDADSHRIHIRSASRSGYSDFGVNRKRLEELRKRFSSSTAPPNREISRKQPVHY